MERPAEEGAPRRVPAARPERRLPRWCVCSWSLRSRSWSRSGWSSPTTSSGSSGRSFAGSVSDVHRVLAFQLIRSDPLALVRCSRMSILSPIVIHCPIGWRTQNEPYLCAGVLSFGADRPGYAHGRPCAGHRRPRPSRKRQIRIDKLAYADADMLFVETGRVCWINRWEDPPAHGRLPGDPCVGTPHPGNVKHLVAGPACQRAAHWPAARRVPTPRTASA